MKNNTEALLIQQNNLLQTQNNLLEQMNKILQQKTSVVQKSLNSGEFIENLKFDEMRSGFLVTSHRKKLWNVQIGLINEFARVCKKHNLRWFAYGGTLLGAVRHKGFIPWDDDVDILMLRPDYEKFKKVAIEEIKEPYFLDDWYNYRLEEDENPLPSESDLPMITREDKDNHQGYWPFMPFLKIRDSRTTMLEIPNRKNVHQGIWIDVFPMDPVPPFNDEKQMAIFNTGSELLIATVFPNVVRKAIENNQKIFLDVNIMRKFLSMTYREKGMFFDNFMSEHFYSSEYVGEMKNYIIQNKFLPYKTKKFEADIVYLPFEKIELPAPLDYVEHLIEMFGDWQQLIYSQSHTVFYSTNIPYREFLEKVNFK